MEMVHPTQDPPAAVVFSASFLQANIFSAILCILAPLLFLWYAKRKKGADVLPFFIGAAFCLLFPYIATHLVNLLVFSLPGADAFLDARNHPAPSALYGSLSVGAMSVLGCFVGLKYAMKKHPGEENALVFGIGIGSLDSILNGTAVYVSNLIAALLINSVGSEEYFKKLGLAGTELAKTRSLFAKEAAAPAASFLTDAAMLIFSLLLSSSVALLVHRAIHQQRTLSPAATDTQSRIASFIRQQRTLLMPAAILVQALGYVPMYLRHIEGYGSSALLPILAGAYALAVAAFVWRL